MELLRLQKYISDCGVMSRRKAEEEIEAVFQLTGDTLLSNYFSLHLDKANF